MNVLRLLRARRLERRSVQDYRESERLRRLSDAYLARSIARLDEADAIRAGERAALTHRV